MRRNSLAFRLLTYAAMWSIVALLGTGWVLSSLFRSAMERNFDARLQAHLYGLVGIVELDESGSLNQLGQIGEARFDLLESGWYWQVSPPSGSSDSGSLSSRSLLDQTFPPIAEPITSTGEDGLVHYYSDGPKNQRLRVIQQSIQLAGSDALYAFTVGGDSKELEREISTFNNTLAIALSLVCLGVIMTGLLQVRFGLHPLRVFQQSLSSIRSGSKTRLSGTYPEELEPLAEELNALLKSNEEIVERARTHVGNLAHALKTPLSVIINEAETDPGPFAGKVSEQAVLMRDQVNHYLDRARVAARGRALGAVTDIAPVVQALHRTLAKIYANKELKVVVSCPDDVRFQGERQDIEEMVGNVLENAFKWAEGSVSVDVSRHVAGSGPDTPPSGQSVAIVIDDDGPGLPDSQKQEALKRGRRLDETTPGTGLGLSIVAELVSLYSGNVNLSDSPLGGLRVTLILPGH